MASSSTALRTWLEQRIRFDPPGAPLPSGRNLAQRFGLSLRTVNRVIAPFIRSGALTGITGRGWFIGQLPAADDRAAPPRTAAEDLAAQLACAISRGEFRQGDVLPGIKYVCSTFNVSPRTASNAYRLLAHKGLISGSGRTFRVGSVYERMRPPRSRHIIVFRFGNADFTPLFRDRPMNMVYSRMVRELQDYGCLLRYRSVDSLDSAITEWHRNGGIPDGLVCTGLLRQWFRILKPKLERMYGLLGPKAPRVLLDFRDSSYRDMRMERVRVLVRWTIHRAAVKALARAVATGGYTSVTVHMSMQGMLWQNKASTLLLLRILPEIERLNPACRVRFAITPEQDTAAERHRIRTEILPPQLALHCRGIYSRAEREAIIEDIAIAPQHEDLFSRPDNAAVWIFDQDTDAARALEWAGEQGLKVPHDLAVIGLGDDPAQYHLGISAVLPDWDTIGHQMAHALLDDVPVALTRQGYLRPGAVTRPGMTTP